MSGAGDSVPDTGPLLSPGFWLHHAALAWRAELDARLAPLGLTPTQFLLLASAGWLEQHTGPATQQQIAELTGADRTMASKVMRVLIDQGLIRRDAHESDGRAVRIRLTPTGRRLTRRAVAVAQAVDAQMFGGEADLRAALRRIAKSHPRRHAPR
ncbi:MarR family winged helix-turn-helix transcriptional regulator [Krasilnikovia sp. MM14-A1004]|uniref:MarR family winged helix-turn-helix transcriptional regulator n=1 Tax=Krasilnikovia sp. MM14-A1004 TaxID=3373541 RepID=UPI00399C570E